MTLELDQRTESAIKGVLALISIVLGLFLDAALANKIVTALGAAAPLAFAVYLDIRSTRRLAKQGIVSTDPVVNAADPRTPELLAAAEKKPT